MQAVFITFFTFLIFNMPSSPKEIVVQSPDNDILLTFSLNKEGAPQYAVSFKNEGVIKPSTIGFDLKGTNSQKVLPALKNNFQVDEVVTTEVNTEWNPVWGEVKTIQNHYRQVVVHLSEKGPLHRKLDIIFRVFNDGVAFRCYFPEQPGLTDFVITDENTQFSLTGNHKAFWLPGDYDSNEFQPQTSTLKDIDGSIGLKAIKIACKTPIDSLTVQTPLMLKSAGGLYINLHEAALVNYPAMNLTLDKKSYTFRSRLVPDALGNKAYLTTPAATPWRTIIVSDDATEILASKMILNLNEPSVIENTSWIKPMKYVGVWWGMHVGTATWEKEGGMHGATTANVKRYIDFASKHGITGVLVEGWNTGWEDWFGKWKEDVFDFVTPYSDFDVKEIQRYAASKNVEMIMHHETSGAVTSYERQMDTAYRFMKQFGYNAVKTGYVGRIIPRGEHHDGQWMVNHYLRVAKKTADYHIMLDAHEPVRPTGLHRTYPNWMACEAGRGNEFNAWSKGNNPDHETILPFTRLMGGPMDYTPGIFQIKMSYYDSAKTEQVHTTLAKQLALYVTMYSPLQMVADLPENYEKHLDAFQFIEDVPVDWDDTKILNAEPGDYITTARKAKGADDWYLGSITDEHARNFEISLDFLTPGKKYEAIIYEDGATADWKTNPMSYHIEKKEVSNTTKLNIHLAPGGGTAISIKAIK